MSLFRADRDLLVPKTDGVVLGTPALRTCIAGDGCAAVQREGDGAVPCALFENRTGSAAVFDTVDLERSARMDQTNLAAVALLAESRAQDGARRAGLHAPRSTATRRNRAAAFGASVVVALRVATAGGPVDGH